MPDVNHHSVSELREHARHYITAVRTDAPENLTHNAQMLANLVERLLDEDGLPEDTIQSDSSPLITIEGFLAAMETADLNDFLADQQNEIKRAYHLLRAVADEAALRANDDDELNPDERKAIDLIDGDERLAFFAAGCGSDDLEERLADEIERNDLDISVGRIDFVKVMNYFQNT